MVSQQSDALSTFDDGVHPFLDQAETPANSHASDGVSYVDVGIRQFRDEPQPAGPPKSGDTGKWTELGAKLTAHLAGMPDGDTKTGIRRALSVGWETAGALLAASIEAGRIAPTRICNKNGKGYQVRYKLLG